MFLKNSLSASKSIRARIAIAVSYAVTIGAACASNKTTAETGHLPKNETSINPKSFCLLRS
jgi:hypothetical protein